MRYVLVLVVLTGVVFTFTEGFAIESSNTQALNKCQELKLVKLINQIVKDTKGLKSKAVKILEQILWGSVKCVFTSFTSLVSCVEDVIEDNVLDFVQEIETYFSTVQRLADKVEELFEECF